MIVKLVGLILPLGLDTFAVAAALGMAGLRQADRLRVSAVFTAFEMGMPLIGFLGGAVFGHAIGTPADYLAIAILLLLGVITFLKRGEEREEERMSLLTRTRGLSVLGLGVSISLDELAIGFTIGLLGLPIPLIVVLIGLQTLLLTQLGLRLGARLGEAVREAAERLAGAALVALGLLLLLEKLLGRG